MQAVIIIMFLVLNNKIKNKAVPILVNNSIFRLDIILDKYAQVKRPTKITSHKIDERACAVFVFIIPVSLKYVTNQPLTPFQHINKRTIYRWKSKNEDILKMNKISFLFHLFLAFCFLFASRKIKLP